MICSGSEALHEELERFGVDLSECPKKGGEDALLCRALDANLSAICLSGGGIRSAAFSLGVVQALARAGALAKFEYVSTVSGGGYIGAWLQTMIASHKSVDKVQSSLANGHAPPELRKLRQYTSYLSPGGLWSADGWANLVLYVRNMLLNLAVYLPILLLPIVCAISYRTLIWTCGWAPGVQHGFLVAASAALAFATYNAARFLPDHRPIERNDVQYASAREIGHWIVAPVLIWAFLAPISMGTATSPIEPWAMIVAEPGTDLWLPLGYAFATAAGYGMAWLWPRQDDRQRHLYRTNSGAWAAAIIVSAAFVYAGIVLSQLVPSNLNAQVLAVIGPFWLLLATGIHSVIFVGLRRDAELFDLDREWLARLNGIKLRAGAGWALFAFCCLTVTFVLHGGGAYTAWLQRPAWVSTVSMVMTGPIAAWLGKKACSRVEKFVETRADSLLSGAMLAQILCALFIVGLLILLGMLVDRVLGSLQPLATYLYGRIGLAPVEPTFAPAVMRWVLGEILATHVAAVVLLLVLVYWLNRRVNVNRYSMHAVYRNRLTRAFPGAARGDGRAADPFTDFDPADNIALSDVLERSGPLKLFPVINMTLNLTAGGVGAPEERKAMAFTATPLRCGASMLSPTSSRLRDDPVGAYVETRQYAGLENAGARTAQTHGLTLATAMAISGAAVSPNWGYHSSSLTAFVMTLFNARLGAWLPNPAAELSSEEMNWAMPKRSLWALVEELLGVTGPDKPAIFLSDGGHFENLGLYEMLRRRCQRILVIDSGQDGGCIFQELGNALRKAEIDLGVTADWIGRPRIASSAGARAAEPALGYAVASIRYPECPKGPDGRIVYLKSTLLADLPPDIQAYADAHPAFPHDTTLDQWFTESQFESYRRLGELQMARLVGKDKQLDLEELFDRAFTPYLLGATM